MAIVTFEPPPNSLSTWKRMPKRAPFSCVCQGTSSMRKGSKMPSALAELVRVMTGLLSGGCVAECAQHGVHAGLVTGALGLEPVEDVLVDAQRDRRLGGDGDESPADHPAHD